MTFDRDRNDFISVAGLRHVKNLGEPLTNEAVVEIIGEAFDRDRNDFISVVGLHHVMHLGEPLTSEAVVEIIGEAFDRDGNGFNSVAWLHHVMNLGELLTDEAVVEIIQESTSAEMRSTFALVTRALRPVRWDMVGWRLGYGGVGFQADFSAFFGLRLRTLSPSCFQGCA